MKSEGFRLLRLGQVLGEELDGLLRDDVRDPSLEGVRVCGVELSVDGRHAKVHVTATPGAARERIERAFERVTPFLRGHLADALDLKFVPALRFVLVEGVWRGDDAKEDS